jgi:hypothetical protein
MSEMCRIRFARQDFDELARHLFPGDGDEHGAVVLAGTSVHTNEPTFFVREVHRAIDGVDYVEGQIGYRALRPQFIHRLITRARDERLAYLAVHNHASDRAVAFSQIDLDSHERGYPALLQISRGVPVGALVMGHRSMQADVWTSSGRRYELDEAIIVGESVVQLTPEPRAIEDTGSIEGYDRQVRMFGRAGQQRLARCRVAVIGLGGIGSLIAEYLGRLGAGHFLLIDNDTVEFSNLSRIVGASQGDAVHKTLKVLVASRVIKEANPDATIETIADDVARQSVATMLIDCDYVFLAADSMRARLVFNAVVHQYLVPGVQVGSKIRTDKRGSVIDIMSANRPVRPGCGCLWCSGFIDPTALAIEAKSDEERKAQEYGVQEPNPSVIALNAVSAAHAVNDFMLDYLGLREETNSVAYEHYDFLKRSRSLVEPRNDETCSECGRAGRRYGRGDLVELPCIY